MLQKFHFVKTVQLPKDSENIVHFGENFKFTLKRGIVTHHIKNIIGDFEITQITESYDDDQINVLKYDKSLTTFVTSDRPETRTLTFRIAVMTKMKEINEAKEICAVTYQLQTPSVQLQWLQMYQFFKDEFVLPGYEDLKFTYFVKKIKKTTDNDIELHIENPYDNVKIQGEVGGDFVYHQTSTRDVDIPVSFCFYRAKNIPDDVQKTEGDIDAHGTATTQVSKLA